MMISELTNDKLVEQFEEVDKGTDGPDPDLNKVSKWMELAKEINKRQIWNLIK